MINFFHQFYVFFVLVPIQIRLVSNPMNEHPKMQMKQCNLKWRQPWHQMQKKSNGNSEEGTSFKVVFRCRNI